MLSLGSEREVTNQEESDWNYLPAFRGRIRHPLQSRVHTILLIDDDEDQLNLFATLLTAAKYQVVAAKTATEAFEVLTSRTIDCIVCDVLMPEVDGQKFLQLIRRTKNLSYLPVVMMTAAREDMEMSLLHRGADMFCKKAEARTRLIPQIRLLLG